VNLFLRLYADCESEEQAQLIAGRVCLALSHFSPSAFAPPKPYWKLVDQYEFTYTLQPPTVQSFGSLIEESSGGWSQQVAGVEASAIWRRQGDHILLVPEVSWANVELHETAP